MDLIRFDLKSDYQNSHDKNCNEMKSTANNYLDYCLLTSCWAV